MRFYALLILGAGCATPAPVSDSAIQFSIPYGLDRYRPVPERNPLTPAKVSLGRRLFFDSLLSLDRSLACASCHDPSRAFTDGKRVSLGVFGRVGRRNVPTLVNRAYGRSFFWDGRTTSLDEQVLHPIQDLLEMDLPLEDAVRRLRGDTEYVAGFQEAFNTPPTAHHLGAALASFVRTILSGNTRFDRWARGDTTALSPKERSGLLLFRGKAGCVRCHVPPTFTDEQFHNTGVAWRDGAYADSGRYVASGRAHDLGAFKTPTLREVVRTAPYMHDGSLARLEDVIEFYDRGGRRNPFLDAAIRPLRLTPDEKRAVLAFLKSL